MYIYIYVCIYICIYYIIYIYIYIAKMLKTLKTFFFTYADKLGYLRSAGNVD